jgi:hypothetical protein
MLDIIAAHLLPLTNPDNLIYAPEGIDIELAGHATNWAVDYPIESPRDRCYCLY